jgi:hypothetical protein
MSLRICVLTNQFDEFYSLMGPFLSNRIVVRELGSPVWDDRGKNWIIASDDSGVVGFCAYTIRRGVAHLSSDYVLPSARRNGIYRQIFRTRLQCLGDMPMVAAATDASKAQYLGAGFTERARRGRYTYVERGRHVAV